MNELEIKTFRAELRALLEKYNASINFSVGSCSDTHGLYDEHMIISHTIPGTFKDIDMVVVSGWGICASDLKED
jgi:hypothetical protein